MDHLDALIGSWEVQVRKGLLEFVVLLSLREREQYGFELMSGLSRHAMLDVPEGTLYPLLLRLSRDALVSSRLSGGAGGAPRKYYALTEDGHAALRAMIGSWQRMSHSVSHMIAGGRL